MDLNNTPPPFRDLSDLARLTIGGPRPDPMGWEGAMNCPEASRWTVYDLRRYYDLIADDAFLKVRRELGEEPCVGCRTRTQARIVGGGIPMCLACQRIARGPAWKI